VRKLPFLPRMPDRRTWYQHAFIYGVDVEQFADGNGDGVGDLRGLAGRLDYLAWLGVGCLWLLPIQPSGGRDNGYDQTDYCAVDPRFGTLDDFDALVAAAHERGMRVMVDLVVGHTSDKHPWFRAARRDRGSPYHGYYIWTDDPSREPSEKVGFPNVETSAWEHVPAVGRYYRHRFYKEEPDLDSANPAVRGEIERIVDFWLARGVDAFRADAARYMRSPGPDPRDPHLFMRWLGGVVRGRRPDAAILAEVDAVPEELGDFFGGGEEAQLLLNFLLGQHVFLALARGEAEPVARGLRLLPERPPGCQWATFLRNLDELDDERLTREEQAEITAAFAPTPDLQAWEGRPRRRLGPMLGGDGPRLRTALSLLFGLPGAPLLPYGDEISLPDDLSRAERECVRTPMDWTAAERQQAEQASLASWVRGLAGARRACPAVGTGAYEVLESGDPGVLVHRCAGAEGAVLLVHNLSSERRTARLAGVFADDGCLVSQSAQTRPSADGLAIELAPHGCAWLRTASAARAG
jgi:maltose alpha-D-glucosyltransferase/alpha-amylase